MTPHPSSSSSSKFASSKDDDPSPSGKIRGTTTPANEVDAPYVFLDSEAMCIVIVSILGRPGVAQEMPETVTSENVAYELVDDEGKSRLTLGWRFPEAQTSFKFCRGQALFGRVVPKDSFWNLAPLSKETLVAAVTSDPSLAAEKEDNHRSVMICLVKRDPGPWPGAFGNPDEPRTAILESEKGNALYGKVMNLDAEKSKDLESITAMVREATGGPGYYPVFPSKSTLEAIGGKGLSRIMDCKNPSVKQYMGAFVGAIMLTERTKNTEHTTCQELHELLCVRLQSILHPSAPKTETVESLPELTALFLKRLKESSMADTIVMPIEEEAELMCKLLDGMAGYLYQEAQKGNFGVLDSFLASKSEDRAESTAVEKRTESTSDENRKEQSAFIPTGQVLDGDVQELCDRFAMTDMDPNLPPADSGTAEERRRLKKKAKRKRQRQRKKAKDAEAATLGGAPPATDKVTSMASIDATRKELKSNQAGGLPPKEPNKENTSSTKVGTMKKISSMSVNAMKKELESYGVPTETFIEKSELIEALEQARSEGLEPPLSLLKNPSLAKVINGFPWKVHRETNDRFGHHFIASTDIPEEEMIGFETPRLEAFLPWQSGGKGAGHKASLQCVECGATTSKDGTPIKFLPCDRCGGKCHQHYCSEACREWAWEHYHCVQNGKRLGEVCEGCMQGISNTRAMMPMMAKLAAMYKVGPKKNQQLISFCNLLLETHKLTPMLEEVAFDSKRSPVQTHLLSILSIAAPELVLVLPNGNFLFRGVNNVSELPVMNLSEVLPSPIDTMKGFLKAYSLIQRYCFATLDRMTFQGQTNFFNHSCVPNASVVIDDVDGVRCAQIFAKKAIPKGQQVFICYCNHATQSRMVRREFLLSVYGFLCQCEMCIADEERPVCDYCEKTPEELGIATPLKTCTRCKQVRYCSRACQKKHWSQHKSYCDRIVSFSSSLNVKI